MPPAKKPVWDKFLSVTVNGVKKGKCKACNTEIVNNPVRLEAHLKKCAAKPDDEDVQQVDGPGPSKVLKQTTMDICISKSKQHEMDLSLVRYFVATNTPFNAAKDFVQKMKPGAVIPDRRRLAGELLDEVYEQEKEKVKVKVRGMNATLAIDGWSTLTNEPVLGVCFICQGVPRNRFSEIHTYGCHAHMANLLSKDILQQKELKAITSKIIAVLKFLRNSHSCTSELQSKNLGRPPIPCETRWNSYVVSLEYFLKNWAQIAYEFTQNSVC